MMASIVLFGVLSLRSTLGEQSRRLSEGVKRTSGIGGHGYKDNDMMTRRRDENTTRYSN